MGGSVAAVDGSLGLEHKCVGNMCEVCSRFKANFGAKVFCDGCPL